METGIWVWWILPAVAGLIGAFLLIGGIGRLIGLRIGTGLARMVLGAASLGIAGVVAFAGLNLQTYKRLTLERPVAKIVFAATDTPEMIRADIAYDDGTEASYELRGDEFPLRARVIKFKPMSTILGYDSIYKLDRLEGGFEDDEGEDVRRVVMRLSEEPGIDVFTQLRERGWTSDNIDASYGSAVYNPMADGLSYTIKMNQSGLEAEPANADAKRAVGMGR